MNAVFDALAFGVQLASGTVILYGAILSLELDVLLDKALKPRRTPEPAPQAA